MKRLGYETLWIHSGDGNFDNQEYFFRKNGFNKIVTDKEEKLNLIKKFKSISVIDMEAFYIKKELIKAKIPMISIKVIFDDLSFDIPLFIQDCINDNGELKRVTLFGKLVLNPLTIFDLLKLNFKFIQSKKVLKDLINNLQN